MVFFSGGEDSLSDVIDVSKGTGLPATLHLHSLRTADLYYKRTFEPLQLQVEFEVEFSISTTPLHKFFKSRSVLNTNSWKYQIWEGV